MQWYFTKNGSQEGPISTESLQSMIASGAVATTDLIWREGMAEWTPAGQVAEFAGGGTAAPPYGTQVPQGGVPGLRPTGPASEKAAPAARTPPRFRRLWRRPPRR